MGFRGHGTEDIHTFRVRHGDMGQGTWGLGLHGDTGGEGDMGFRVRHGDIHHMGTWGLGGMGWKGTWVGKGAWGLDRRHTLRGHGDMWFR